MSDSSSAAVVEESSASPFLFFFTKKVNCYPTPAMSSRAYHVSMVIVVVVVVVAPRLAPLSVATRPFGT